MSLALARALLVADLLPRAQIAHHLAHAIRSGRSLARVLADVDEELVLGALAKDPTPLVPELKLDVTRLARLPDALPDRLGVVPLSDSRDGGAVTLAMMDPSDRHAALEVERLLGQSVLRVRARPNLLLQSLRQQRPATFQKPRVPPPSAPPFSMGATGEAPRSSNRTQRPGPSEFAAASLGPYSLGAPRLPNGDALGASELGSATVSSQPMTPRLHADEEPSVPLVRRTTPQGVAQSRPTMPTPGYGTRLGSGALPLPSAGWAQASLPPPPPMRSLTPSVMPGAGLTAFTRMPLDEYAVRLTKLREAKHRDDLTGELLTLAHAVAERALVMAVKGDRYVGWAGSVALGNVRALSVSAREPTVFTRAALEDGYLGPLVPMPGHHALLEVLTGRADGGLHPVEIAVWPVIAARRPALFVVATRLTDPLVATQRISEMCHAASQGLMRLLRMSR